MPETRAKACTGKARHPDRATAERHRWGLIRNGASPAQYVAYRCRFCGSWHVGHRMRAKGMR